MKSFLITLLLMVGLSPITNNIFPSLLSLEESLPKIRVLENNSYKPLSVEEDEIKIPANKDLEVMAKFNYEPFRYEQLDSSSKLTDEVVNEYRSKLFKAGREYHLKRNESILTTLKTDNFDDVYLTKYGPYMTFSVSSNKRSVEVINDIKTLAQNEIIEFVEIKESVEPKNLMYDATEAVGVTFANRYDFMGDGVKVGILEVGVPDRNNAALSGVDITIRNELLEVLNIQTHTTVVSSIVAHYAMAPDAKLYCASISGSNSDEVDWFLDNEVNIINCSFGDGSTTGTYTAMSAYFDYIVYGYGVTVVCAAGNNGLDDGYVTNPAIGYNVITVGASATQGPLPAGFSSKLTLNGFIKPNILAPGIEIEVPNIGCCTGTSFAAPIVTGVLAKLFEQFPIMKAFPEVAMAVLASSATFWGGMSVTDPTYRLGYGCGMINYDKARTAIMQKVTFFESLNIARCNLTNIERGDRKKASLCWLYPANGSLNVYFPDMAFTLAKPGWADDTETYVLKSDVENSNIETIIGEIEAEGTIQYRAINKTPTRPVPTRVGIAVTNDYN